MEFTYSSMSILFASLLILFMLFGNVKKSIANNSTLKLPPGPWQLPIIGNMHQLVGFLTHHILRDLAKKHGPLMHLKLGQVSAIVISSPEIAKQIMKTHDIFFSNRPYLLASKILFYDSMNIGFLPYGEYWRQLRKICTLELLCSKRVRTFRSIREEEVLNLIISISLNEKSPINLSKKIFSLTYGITARAVFGRKSKDQEAFIALNEEVVGLAAGFNISDMFPSFEMLQVISGLKGRLERMHKRIDEMVENIVNEHKERKTTMKTVEGEVEEDLVDVLLRIQRNGDLEVPITNNGIKAVIWEIFSAGSETSSTVVEWAISEMLKNPKVMKRAQEEVRQVFDETKNVNESNLHQLKYLQSVIKETLRLHPPSALLLPRECSETCEIDGYKIPAKTKIIVNGWAINRDPKYWNEAEKFNPERFLQSEIDFRGNHFEYIPFGAGRRICPGITFAMANIELPIAQLLYHFDWELPGGMKHEEFDMTEAFGLTVRRKNDLYLIPVPHNPPSLE